MTVLNHEALFVKKKCSKAGICRVSLSDIFFIISESLSKILIL